MVTIIIKLFLIKRKLNAIERDNLANEILDLFIDCLKLDDRDKFFINKLFNNELNAVQRSNFINELAMRYNKDPVENRKKIGLYLSIIKMYMDILRSD